MTSKTLVEILREYSDGLGEHGKIEIGEAKILTFYVSMGGEALMVADVVSVEMKDDLALAITRKGDLFAMSIADIRALRVQDQVEKKRTGLIR